mgnify:FL=1
MLKIFQDVFTPSNTMFLLEGLGLTLVISVVTVALGILLGTILGLLRSYDRFILGRLAAVYIEIFRNTPLLLWIFVFYILIPVGTPTVRGAMGMTLFTSAVIAEIVRGGLNSVHHGQFEAAASQGFSFFQTLWYIVLPQCFRRIVPSLLSQVVTTIKDTSFLYQVAIAEFFYRAKNLMSSLSKTVVVTSGHVFTIFAVVAIVYFLINFSISVAVRSLQRRREKTAVSL